VTTKRTYCRICEAACGLIAEVRGDRVVQLRPDREHPVSRGYVCAKGTRFAEVAYHPRRLTQPTIRRDGALEATSWPKAIDQVAAELTRIRREHGPHAVAVYFGNPLAFNAKASLTLPAFLNALATRNVFGAGSQDCNNKFAAARIVHGSEVIQAFPDFSRCDLAVVLGSNPLVSQSSFVHLEGGARVFDELIARGGHAVWVDPRRTESAQRWGEHVPITPGGDAWLLLALLRRLADQAPRHARVSGLDEVIAASRSVDDATVAQRTGLTIASIDALAKRIAKADRVAFHLSVGVNLGGFGTLSSVLLAALSWVTGNFDREGGLLIHPWAKWIARAYRLSGLEDKSTSRVGGFGSSLGTLPAGVLADEIALDGPDRVRALVCIAGDPVRSVPGPKLRDAIASLEFVVSIDMFENATGELADVLLPTTSWLERWDMATASMLFQRGGLLQASAPVVQPLGECRHDAAIVAELARAMGHAPLMSALRFDVDRWLPSGRHGFRQPELVPGRWLESNAMCLWDARLDGEMERLHAAGGDDDAGFRLVGRRRRLGHNSWLHGATRDGDPEAVAWLGPDDMQMLGLSDGDVVEVRTTAGALSIPAVGRSGVAARTVVIPHGLPDINVNAIIPSGPDAIERLSGNLLMTGIPASVAAVGA
jgi:anaerobic selenocysteine-containing dehydrogenase